MKQKKFKIEGTTLFVYRPQMRSNNGDRAALSDPITKTVYTTVSTGVFQR
jgi:hypothetical protein